MKPYLILIAMIILGIHCSKDDDTPAEDRNEMMRDTKWVIIENIAFDSMDRQTDLMEDVPAYQSDDYLYFKADSTYELNDNQQLRTDTASPIIDAGIWELSPNQQQLLRKSNVFQTEYLPATIKELTRNNLFLETYSSGDRSYIRTRYQKLN